jgi:hypothetical protein
MLHRYSLSRHVFRTRELKMTDYRCVYVSGSERLRLARIWLNVGTAGALAYLDRARPLLYCTAPSTFLLPHVSSYGVGFAARTETIPA